MVELGELERLSRKKQKAECCGRKQPDLHSAYVAALNGGEREHHAHAAHQEDERADGCEGDVEKVRRIRSRHASVPVEQVGGNQRPEE